MMRNQEEQRPDEAVATWVLEKGASSTAAPPRLGFCVPLQARVMNESRRLSTAQQGAGEGQGDVNLEEKDPGGQGELQARATWMRWYGRGPHESYIDRATGARLGCFQGPVASQTFRYVRPQETGNRLDTRWAVVGDPGFRRGVLVSGHAETFVLGVQAHHFTLDDLEERLGMLHALRESRDALELRVTQTKAALVVLRSAGSENVDPAYGAEGEPLALSAHAQEH